MTRKKFIKTIQRRLDGLAETAIALVILAIFGALFLYSLQPGAWGTNNRARLVCTDNNGRLVAQDKEYEYALAGPSLWDESGHRVTVPESCGIESWRE